ncbi:TetR/AcrR family transcriptional regulator [Salsipaludibacter albus]|uniref:TetR/AcrR family transcriptional regulator n=1 Tax=Salsipaludibacter albus TaxID=2849650 RepID=UPI001EE45EC8|nr:TetR/AcrR family transcriptional regulator [Salsipaludibacter albus]MBY5163883.1 TetR/AcrR family transcriptional regulator [Salsipaludibacter albus]
MARYRVGIETRERILDATRQVLGDQGLESATLKAITDRAGVGAGSFYNLFESKEAAIWEVLAEAITAVDPDPDGHGSETVDDLVTAFVAFVTGETATLARIHLQLAGMALTAPDVAAPIARSHARRVDRFQAAMRRHDPELDQATAVAHAELLLGALTGLAIRNAMDPDFDLAAHAAALPRHPGDRASSPLAGRTGS